MSPASTPATAKKRGFPFQFIPIRQAHLDMMAVAYGRDVPPITECLGRSMVDENFLPLGFAMAWFEPGGIVSIHAHFGKWLHIYPKDILRGIKVTLDELRALGVEDLYTVVDVAIPGAFTLVEWFKGEPTGYANEIGPVYKMPLSKMKV